MLMPCTYCRKEPTVEELGEVDRVRVTMQYAPGTVVPTCHPCNIAKWIFTPEEFWGIVCGIKYYKDQDPQFDRVWNGETPVKVKDLDLTEIYQHMLFRSKHKVRVYHKNT
eukprot:GHVU01059324.1.p4 GENE.GHVU01059324.1~~GHVU01059324.1.p4  ORF type:complete len:110 (-),score=14.16 GHVU01059324.1:1412-1741(-)